MSTNQPRCTCAVGPPCVLYEGGWYCITCWCTSAQSLVEMGDTLASKLHAFKPVGNVGRSLRLADWPIHHGRYRGRAVRPCGVDSVPLHREVLVTGGHPQHQRRHQRLGLPAQKGATVRALRGQGSHARQPVPLAVRRLSVSPGPVRSRKDSQ